MITLRVYPYNLNGYGEEYICKNLYFNDFYIGMRRDEVNLMVIRRFCEGEIILRNPIDFDVLSPYFSQDQDAHLYYENVYHWCRISFKDANYSSKTVSITIKLIDDYSKIFDGIKVNSQTTFVEPLIEREVYIREFGESPTQVFIDGSSYMEGDLWGVEEITVTKEKDIKIDDIWLWNIGGEVSIEDLVVGLNYMERLYIPVWVKYTDKSFSKFKECQTKWRREYRYIAETETIDGDWETLETETLTINGIVYIKHYKMIDGSEAKWFNHKDNYFIRDESDAGTPYMTAEYQGYSDSLQKSHYFYDIYDLFTKLLIVGGLYVNNLYKDIYNAMYIASFRAYNEEKQGDKFQLGMLVNMFRDKFGIYFKYDGTNAFLKNLNWYSNKLIDIDNYLGFNFYENNKPKHLPLPRMFNFESGSNRIDFGNQSVSFTGYLEGTESKAEGISCDVEKRDKSPDSYILVHTVSEERNQIYKQFRYDGIIENGIEAIFRSENGRYISWNYDRLESSTYIDFKLISNNIYSQLSSSIYISFSYVIYKGYVKISVENKNWTVGRGDTMDVGSVSGYFNISGSDIIHMVIELMQELTYDSRGFIYNIQVSPQTKVPQLMNGIISRLPKRNGSICLANTVKNYEIPMSYTKGILKGYGEITCKTVFNREIEVFIPLENISIFDIEQVFEKYLGYSNEKYCIFERKKKILTETEESKFDTIIARTNEVY
jgi:hypothetical protein